MNNLEVARVLYEIAELLEMQNVAFKPRAYQKAARVIESLSEDINEIYKQGKLTELECVGESIAKKIEELLKTGRLKYYEGLKKELPINIAELMRVPGLGPKRIMLLNKMLNVKNLNDLEKAAKQKRIQNIKGLGAKVEEDILRGIAIAKKREQRYLLGYVKPIADNIKNKISALKSVEQVEICGSYRRGKETVGDLDILVTTTKPEEVIGLISRLPDVSEILAKGDTKITVRLSNGMQVDVRVVADKEFGSALQYFTGNKDHNVELRKIALSKGYTLSEYGLFTLKGKKWVAGRTEKEIYDTLGLVMVPPEMRENRGELSLKSVPKILEYDSLKGDFQVHTKWSDGGNTIKEMTLAAQKLGLKFITITDHVSNIGITNPLDEKRLRKQMAEIDKLNKKIDIRIFKGAEVDILKDGSLALSKKLQKQLDVVLGAVHMSTKMTHIEMTNRICKALENNRIHTLAHPTGRIIQEREAIAFDMEKVFQAAKDTNTFLDIDCYPNRMDLNDVNVMSAKKIGCKFSVSTDAHSTGQLQFLRLGETIARRAWLSEKDVLNTYGIREIEKTLKSK